MQARAVKRLQRAWRVHKGRAAAERIRHFFAVAQAAEVAVRAATEEEARAQRRAAAKARLEVREAEERRKREAREARRAAREAMALVRTPLSDAAGCAAQVEEEEEARAQRKEDAKARLHAREEEERIKREAGEARVTARRAKVQATQAPSSPATRAPPSQTTDPPAQAPAPLPPSPPSPPSPQSFLPSWRHAHAAACTLQRAWHRRVQRAEAAAEARAAIVDGDRAVACRLATLEAEKAAMEGRTTHNIATARAFRRLEAELHEQGIRIASGVGTGGRQRKRLHERRRAERRAEGLLVKELATAGW